MEATLELPRTNFDTPWKEVLDMHFQPFMEMCHPEAARAIDWSRGYEPLDKELNAITKASEIGKRIADKLMKVWQAQGEEIWVLFHVEIQGQQESNFPERMYIYHYRLFDRYHKPIVSLAILADDKPAWRPSSYVHQLWGCNLHFDYVSIKLLDYESRREELLASDNPFAVVILAHIAALRTKRSESSRFASKLALTRSLYDKGWAKEAIINLYLFIDWVMALSEPFELQYLQEIENFEKEKNMAYVSSAERRGIRSILLLQLQSKFGTIPSDYRKRIEEADAEKLQKLAAILISANSLKEILTTNLEQTNSISFEQEGNMAYISSDERIGFKKGLHEGEKNLLLRLMQSKFGSIPSDYQKRIEEADAEKLHELAAILISANSLKEIFND